MKGLKLKCLLVFLVCVALVQANIPQPPLQTYDKTTTGTIPDLDQNRDYVPPPGPEQKWCAPTASADCVWYYGSGSYPNLIPPGASDPCKADTMITNLGALMATSDAAGGTTVPNAEAGLQAYYDGQYPGAFFVNVYTAWTFPDPTGAPSASNLWNWMTNNLHDCNDVLPILWLPGGQQPQPPSSDSQVIWDTPLDSITGHLVMMTAYDYTQNPDQITIYDPDDDVDGAHAFPGSIPAPLPVTSGVTPVLNPAGPGTTALSTNPDGFSPPWIVGAIISGPGPLVEDPNVKWSQPPVPVPDMPGYYIGWDEPSLDRWDTMVLDDFLCDSNQPVTKIRWWGSLLGYSDDMVPADLLPQGFYITFWDDVPDPDPCDPATYSHPGNLLHEIFCFNWTYDFYGWEINPFDPCGIPLAKFEFEQELLPEEYWEQETEQGIYWLGIMALYDPCDPCDPQYPWGWETRPHFFQDDAVRLFANPLVDPPPYDVSQYDPIKGPMQETWDLSFELLSIPPEPQDLDYGDAPDTPYPTYLANDGARHIIDGVTYLGAGVDSEPDGQPDPAALGDDNDGNDDEDGVVQITPFIAGGHATIKVIASAPGMLDAWMDFGRDGSWLGDQIFASRPLSPGGNLLSFVVPAGTAPGPGVFGRFRFSTAGGLPDTGVAADGEVEDHQFAVEEEIIKWSQPPTYNHDSPIPECFWGWDEPSVYGSQVWPIVSDDWNCTDQRPVSDIHWWGSYLGWDDPCGPPQPAPNAFHVGVWTDVPVGDPGNPYPWSHPGFMLHEWIVPVADVIEQVVGCDFHPDPCTPMFVDTCFRYDWYIPQEQWFWQEGTPTEPIIYWLSISAIYDTEPMEYVWGWKTRRPEWNDDAVRILFPYAPIPGVEFMDGIPIETIEGSWDMAFELTTQECFPSTHADYSMWLKAGAPPCWCPTSSGAPGASNYQCKGDANGGFGGKDKDGKRQWVTGPDLTILSNGWQKVDTDAGFEEWICADFNHGFGGKDKDGKRQWVTGPDLTILSNGWQKVDTDAVFTTTPGVVENPCFPVVIP